MKNSPWLLAKLAAGTAVTLALALSGTANAQQGKTLRFIPHSNLSLLDPTTTTAYITRNHGYLVYDTLFGTNENFETKPQMVDSFTLSDDKLTWTFKLRDQLKFHDGQPVRPQDIFASLRRWSVRDSFGQKWAQMVDTMAAIDDRTFTIKVKQPFPLLIDGMGKLSSNVPFIMPERVANTDPFQNITEAIGSGPFKFVREEWNPGNKAVYVRNPDYVPRSDPPSWSTGAKIAKLDRIEWRVISDPATALAALQSGEVDYYEQPPVDLLPVIARNPNIKIQQIDRIGSMAMLRFNFLNPPFDNPKMRQALLYALNQQDYLQAIIGNPEYYKECTAFFTCGSPMSFPAGLEMMKGPRNLDKAKQLIQEAGYKGEKIVIISPTDIPTNHLQSQVTNEALRKLGLNVDFVATDWGTILQRRSSKKPVAEGGWNIFHTWWVGPDLVNPAVNAAMRGNGETAWAGWPTNPKLEQLRDQWFAAPSVEEQKNLALALQQEAATFVPYVPTGQFFQPIAFRTNVTGIIEAPVIFFWNIDKR